MTNRAVPDAVCAAATSDTARCRSLRAAGAAGLLVAVASLASGCGGGAQDADPRNGAAGTEYIAKAPKSRLDQQSGPSSDRKSSGKNSGGETTDPGTEPSPGTLTCNGDVGLTEPLQLCTADNPCTRVAAERQITQITSPSEIPRCRTTFTNRLFFDDGPALTWTDNQGTRRYGCFYEPPAADVDTPLPLVVFLHGGGGGSADTVYNLTNLRHKATYFDFAGDGSRRGFHLLSIQGRNLHFPTVAPRDGSHHDYFHRHMASPSSNPDIASLDHIIDRVVRENAVDKQRIYLVGWSNGGFFAQLYGVARRDVATADGNRVAAAVSFTGGDPFNDLDVEHTGSCQLDPYPRSDLPVYLLTRSCDIVACNAEQAAGLEAQGINIEPGHIAAAWLEQLKTTMGNASARWSIISGSGTETSSCTPTSYCTAGIATTAHVSWPDGISDNSGIDHEPAMLDFLRLNHR